MAPGRTSWVPVVLAARPRCDVMTLVGALNLGRQGIQTFGHFILLCIVKSEPRDLFEAVNMSTTEAGRSSNPSGAENTAPSQETPAFSNASERSEDYKQKLDRLADEARRPTQHNQEPTVHPLVEKGQSGGAPTSCICFLTVLQSSSTSRPRPNSSACGRVSQSRSRPDNRRPARRSGRTMTSILRSLCGSSI